MRKLTPLKELPQASQLEVPKRENKDFLSEVQTVIKTPLVVFSKKITDASNYIQLAFKGMQLVVYNPTSKVLKLGDSNVNTNDYLFVVQANKYFISPVFYFSEITVFVDSFAAFSGTTPFIYIYDKPMFNPMMSSIT